MTTGDSKSRSTLFLIGALIAAVLVACADHEPGALSSIGLGVYIEAPWREARTMPGHQVHVVEQKIACVKCHELGGDSIGAVTPARCAACHEKEAKLAHASEQAQQRFGPTAKADCTTCHTFTTAGSGHVALDGAGRAADGEIHRPSDCAHCHLVPQGDTPAMVVHGGSECVGCHKPHESAGPQPGDCADCHGAVSTTHAAHGKSAIAVCTTCHQHQHAPASEARETCAGCHAKEKPLVPATALFAEGHQECIGCHRPHQFETAQAVACRSCHEGVHALSEQRVPQHRRCESCHKPHDVRGSAAQACAGCHSKVHSDHPKLAGGACTGCHDAHPERAHAHASAQKCSSCHQIAASEAEFHGGTACKQCHAPHQFKLAGSHPEGVCQNCHSQQLTQVSALAGHKACASCHRGLPHRPATLTAECQQCHGAAHREANRGHKVCTNCHEPHGGKVGRECKSCHATEHRTAPAGHKDCRSCHEAHGGSRKAECASCHKQQAATKHGQLRQDCAGCHRPHGPEGTATPPACSSCHKPASLSGLHAVDKHRDCARCHTGHGDAPGAARTACLSCHTDRKNHFPDAPRCASCHLFGKTR